MTYKLKYIIVTAPQKYMNMIKRCITTLSNLAQVSTYSKNYNQKVLTISVIKQLVYQSTISHSFFEYGSIINTNLWNKSSDFLAERARNIISISYGFFENYLIKHDTHIDARADFVLNPYIANTWSVYNLCVTGLSPANCNLSNIILYKNKNKVEIIKKDIKSNKQLFQFAYDRRVSKVLKWVESIYTVTVKFTVSNYYGNYNDDLVTLYINANTPGVKTNCELPTDDYINRPTLKKIRQKNANKNLIVKEFKRELESL